MGVYVVSDGSARPYRVKIRAPGFVHGLFDYFLMPRLTLLRLIWLREIIIYQMSLLSLVLWILSLERWIGRRFSTQSFQRGVNNEMGLYEIRLSGLLLYPVARCMHSLSSKQSVSNIANTVAQSVTII